MHAPGHPERPRRGGLRGLLEARRRGERRLSHRFELLALFAVAATVLACRESRSVPVRTAVAPRRVVTLAPNLTEIVFALGAGGALVGVSDNSDFPPEARALPRVGGLEVSAEKVASLSPDLVLATMEGNARGPVSALEAAGLSVTVVPTGSLDAVLSGIRLVGDALGRRAEGERLAGSLARRRSIVRARASAHRRPRTILLVWPDPPQAAGGGTFLDDVLEDAGAENLLAARPGWPVVSAEYLATAPVEVLVLPASGKTWPVFERALSSGALSRGAVRRARVLRLDESALTRPGPRVFDALEELAAAFQGGAAPEPR